MSCCLDRGPDGQIEVIETTAEHPFYVTTPATQGKRPAPVGHEELNTHWVGAGHLQTGDKLKLADGRVGEVLNVTTLQKTQEMFNLSVAEAHTFYVGQNGWLVHNNKASPKLPTATTLRNWAKAQGYKMSLSGNIEVWSDPTSGEWRLKIKPPSEHENIHAESKEFRYSARKSSGEYFDPITGEVGTRKSIGHLPFDPCDFYEGR